jgi:hypothetical protein
LSVGVQQIKIFVEAFRPSAGEVGSIPLIVMSDETVRAPVLGLGSEIGRRDKRVGPRWMLIVGDGRVVEEEGIVGTTE